ncbi:MAG: DUF488 domain-containing protein [Methanomicrobiales archaeon]|nr:DUF488 domain-containing protein [Methanomicrobiales archaeon]
MDPVARTLWTVGHSTLEMEKFLRMLSAHTIAAIVDVRSIPHSRRSPWFGGDHLMVALPEAGIRYVWMPALGGFRHPLKDSVNTGWIDPAFRGYADYMQSGEFSRALEALIRIAEEGRTAVLCAEGNPYRCHRRLIADSLTARSVRVLHITSLHAVQEHRMTPFAQVHGTGITYPAPQKNADEQQRSLTGEGS